MSDRAPLLFCGQTEPKALKAALLLANTNSIVLDFAARTAVGGTDLSYFIIKQLPILPLDNFLLSFKAGVIYADLVISRVLELTYTSDALRDFAEELGFYGPPFRWSEERRHCVRCELDAILAHLYGLNRADLEWILDAPAPSASFASLKQSELRSFGEYRTKRYVLKAFDSLEQGQIPNLHG